jgi:hypothetical protein
MLKSLPLEGKVVAKQPDEVESPVKQFDSIESELQAQHLISRLRRQLPLKGKPSH